MTLFDDIAKRRAAQKDERPVEDHLAELRKAIEAKIEEDERENRGLANDA